MYISPQTVIILSIIIIGSINLKIIARSQLLYLALQGKQLLLDTTRNKEGMILQNSVKNYKYLMTSSYSEVESEDRYDRTGHREDKCTGKYQVCIRFALAEYEPSASLSVTLVHGVDSNNKIDDEDLFNPDEVHVPPAVLSITLLHEVQQGRITSTLSGAYGTRHPAADWVIYQDIIIPLAQAWSHPNIFDVLGVSKPIPMNDLWSDFVAGVVVFCAGENIGVCAHGKRESYSNKSDATVLVGSKLTATRDSYIVNKDPDLFFSIDDTDNFRTISRQVISWKAVLNLSPKLFQACTSELCHAYMADVKALVTTAVNKECTDKGFSIANPRDFKSQLTSLISYAASSLNLKIIDSPGAANSFMQDVFSRAANYLHINHVP
ncbi:hypothetical protein C8R48DRAFT_675152 [Suillus tomentosus]|nr:hypothetical protein C8R48DRAFT_675152 [Suillus tomentosus]